MATTEILRYAFGDLDDTIRKVGRAINFGDLRVALADPQGNLSAGSASLVITDLPDHPIATRLGTAGQGFFYGDQIEVFCRSRRGRETNATPNLLARVLLDDDSCDDGATARFKGTDPFFAVNTSTFGPDKKFPYVPFPRYYVNAPEDVFSKFLPVIGGEVTDAGTKDPLTDLPNPRGKCPLTYVGEDGLPTGPGGTAEVWGRFNVCWGAIYKITGLFGSDLGGGLYGLGTATSNGADPSVITLTSPPSLTGVPVDGSQTITLYTTAGRVVSKITAISGATVTIDGVIATASATAVDWAIGEAGSSRAEIDLNVRNGVDVMVPKWPNYVRSTDYEDLLFAGETTRVTDVWVRGPLLQAHLNGEVTLTVNAIGIEDKGDGTGLPITDYFTFEYWWYVNCAVVNTRMPGGVGFVGKWPQTDGDIAAIGGAFADGIYKVNGASFAAAQAWSRTVHPGGFKISAYFVEPEDMRTVAQKFQDNAGCPVVRTGENEAGQIFKWFLDANATTTAWPRVVRAERVFGATRRWNAKSEIENVTQGTCDWDPDGETWRRGLTEKVSDSGLLHAKGVRLPSKHLDGKLVADQAQWEATLQLRNNYTRDGPWYVKIEGGDPGLWDLKVGSGFLYTDDQLSLASEPLYILEKVFRLPRSVDLLCLDVGAGPVVNGVRTRGPSYGLIVMMPVGTLGVTGQLPIAKTQTQTPVGSLSLTGRAPNLKLGLAVPVGSIGLTGRAPTVVVA